AATRPPPAACGADEVTSASPTATTAAPITISVLRCIWWTLPDPRTTRIPPAETIAAPLPAGERRRSSSATPRLADTDRREEAVCEGRSSRPSRRETRQRRLLTRLRASGSHGSAVAELEGAGRAEHRDPVRLAGRYRG